MIVSFAHKGLERFYRLHDLRGIQAKHAERLARILMNLNAAERPSDMNLPGYHFHPLLPKNAGIYAVSVSGNWRVTFRMIDGNAEIVDYLDYH